MSATNNRVDLQGVLKEAYTNTKSKGASTACIFTLVTHHDHHQSIQGINIGDSGLLVVRKNSVVYKSPLQQHSFNCPYQLGSSSSSDTPTSAQMFQFGVVEGDVIVAGTDGLFDNLSDWEMVAVVVKATRGLSPQEIASKLVEFANIKSNDHNCSTPFSINAQKAGLLYQGGKPDDITAIVSLVIT